MPSGFDSRRFERELKKSVEKAANDGLQKIGHNLQRAFDSVYNSHKGEPVAQVRTTLASALRRADFTADDAQLRSWSEAISEGRHITVDVKPARL